MSTKRTETPCPKPTCPGILLEKKGKFGRFLGCSKWPACQHTEQIKTETTGSDALADDFFIRHGLPQYAKMK